MSNNNEGGLKYDENKIPVDLLPTEALLRIAEVLDFGRRKYSSHNWRQGILYSRVIAAAMRHLLAYNNSEDKDPESNLSHLAHAACCIMFLLEFEKTHPELDDRYVQTTSGKLRDGEKVSSVTVNDSVLGSNPSPAAIIIMQPDGTVVPFQCQCGRKDCDGSFAI